MTKIDFPKIKNIQMAINVRFVIYGACAIVATLFVYGCAVIALRKRFEGATVIYDYACNV